MEQNSVDEASARYSALAGAHYEAVYRFAAHQIQSSADAADVTQQTFIRGFHAFDKFDEARPFAPWIFRIARRAIADHYRSRRVSEELVDEGMIDDYPDPRTAADEREERDLLWDCARGLKPRLYQALWLHYQEDLDLREVAEAMNISITHAKVLLFRARRALRRTLERPSKEKLT